MGNSSWDADTTLSYNTYASTIQTQDHGEIFQNRSINKDFDPKNITLRESVDSEANPESFPIIIGMDVTGSMGMIPERVIKKGFSVFANSLLEDGYIDYPHVMTMAIGDISYDQAPLQCSQFEADLKIVDQMKELYIEGGGGGNRHESYDLPWVFAANKVHTDSFEKRGKKGILFTIGDENFPEHCSRESLDSLIGIDIQGIKITAEESLAKAQEKWNVFHIIVTEGNHCLNPSSRESVISGWRERLGKRAIVCNDYRHISEIMCSIIMLEETDQSFGRVIDTWNSKPAKKAVKDSLGALNQQ